MSSIITAHSKKSSLGGGATMIGMIRARKLAVKLKKRAKFLVSERCRRDNTGKSAIVHRDFPRVLRPDMHGNRTFLYNTGFVAVTPSSRSPSVLSKSGNENFRNRCPLQNTHQLQPAHKFNAGKVKEVIEEVLFDNLRGKKYECSFCKEISKKLSELIKQRVKLMGFSRYKFISMVYIGQICNQGLRIGSRCLWNQNFDSLAEVCYRDRNLFAVATLYGVYCE